MADAHWRYGDGRQQPAIPPLVAKRPRSDFEVPGGQELPSYYGQDDGRGPNPIGATYDSYLRTQITTYGGVESTRAMNGGLTGHPMNDPRVTGPGISDPAVAAKSRTLGLGAGRPELPLPPDATNTLFVEGLPPNTTRREVSHIFRPFVGYKEVRLVPKESRQSRDHFVLCFVDFVSPAHAATALDALQGYKFDEHDRDSVNLRLQFARNPGVRTGGGHRGKR